MHPDATSLIAHCTASIGAEGESNDNPFGQVIPLTLKSDTPRL